MALFKIKALRSGVTRTTHWARWGLLPVTLLAQNPVGITSGFENLETEGPGKWHDSVKVTHLVNCRAKIGMHTFLGLMILL